MVSDADPGRVQVKNSFVKIRYRLRTAKGEYVRGAPGEGKALLEVYTGYRQLLPGLERRLVGLTQGEKAEIRIPPEDAFGPVREDLVKEKRYEDFPQGRALEEGRWVEARDEKTRTAYGYFVRKKASDRIVLDYNHPLAGEELVYDLELVEVRPASEEERILLRPCAAEGNDPE